MAGKIWDGGEDVNCGLTFGSDKTGKMECTVPDASGKLCTISVSVGGKHTLNTDSGLFQ